jgi:hypothetical protein
MNLLKDQVINKEIINKKIINKEIINKNVFENLDKNMLLDLSYDIINNNEFSKLNEKCLDILNQNIDTIYLVISKYGIAEEEKRNIILDKASEYNKILYKPIDIKKQKLENIRKQIELLEIELDEEKIANAFANVFNSIINTSDLSSKIKKLNTKYNKMKKELEKLEYEYSKTRENTMLPFGEFYICMDRLKSTLEIINTSKQNITENEYINSFEKKNMIPYDFTKHNISNEKENLLKYIRFRKVETELDFYDYPIPILNSDDELNLTVIFDVKERLELMLHLLNKIKVLNDNESFKNEILELKKSCPDNSSGIKKEYYLLERKYNNFTFEVVFIKYTTKRISCTVSTYIVDIDKTILDLVN